MSFLDLFLLILENLSRRKARVSLTAIGVVIGTAAVVILVSLAIGLQSTATQNIYGMGDLTLISVYPNYGDGAPTANGTPPIQKKMNRAALDEMAAIPGVIAVIPREGSWGGTILQYGRLEGWVGITGVGTKDLSDLGLEAQDGTLKLDRGTAVIGSMIPNNFYDPKMRPGQTPPEPPDLVGQQIKLILIKYDPQGLEIRKTVQVRIVGLLPETKAEHDWTMYMSLDDVTTYNEWMSGTRMNYNKNGYNQAVVKVDSVDHVLEINDAIVELGYQAYTPQSTVQGVNSFFLILQVAFGSVGAIALLVAAIGIANTMTMAILERTREIGLMKAIGATNRDVLTVFLGEAAGIGFLGGLGGVLLGWSAGQVINVLAIAYMAGTAAQQGGPPPTTAVITPLWLPAFSLLFATLVGLISGLYPALRAATLVPVTALKYE